MKLLLRVVFFLIINFGALAFGSWLMNNGPTSSWYQGLQLAPWTPPGWVFGFAWTTIMICFSIYLAYLFSNKKNTTLLLLFTVQLVLNISWNYLFFNQHWIVLGLVDIVLLTLLVGYFIKRYYPTHPRLQLLLLPYLLWLCIATSLNFYIVLYN
ncbi:MAG: TspO/MBR family protein [Bacteroidota bacterium]